LQQVVQLMGIDAKISSELGENGAITLRVESEDSAILIGRKGRSLESMQYLINRMIQRGEGEEGERITIDIEGYLDRRQEALEDLAMRLADRAKESGRRQRTKPMSAQERRIIHVALENDPDVRTFSHGDPVARFVVIAPKDEKQGAGEDRPPRERGRRGGRGRRDDNRGPRPPHQTGNGHQHAADGEFADGAPMNDGTEQREGQRQDRPDDAGDGNRRRRYRRGRRGRGGGGGPRPDAAPQPEAAGSESQES
ncbi:MAG TPA: KH domain-containing protein, partial [Candidatus Hydrogenedentes bacterium]|nr:KH domain-containing protein [Candidatus Hydrogenedentota bacterium]